MLPFLTAESENSKKYVINFQGLNLGEGYAEGEFSDCKNLSSVLAPCISQRFGRSSEVEYEAPTAIHAKDGLFVIDGTNAIYNGRVVGQVNPERKQMATVGDYIVIFPDKLFYNVETGEFGSMEPAFRAASGAAVFTDSTITISGASYDFRAGDTITISGCTTHSENNKAIICRSIEGDTLRFYENSFTAGTEAGEVLLMRVVPDLDFICESNYRLWGTKGNTIFGSKYSDPFNFESTDGVAGDSYWIEVATDGPFTGCIPYSSHICFFKENVLHKLYGSKPSNFQLVTSQVYGVQEGSERSMKVINETLYYKGVGGVYAYTGGVPELVSAKFGQARFADACAETDGERYYISMRRGDEWGVYVYDVSRNIWLKEDNLQCVDMAFHDGHVYLLSADCCLYRIDSELEKTDMEWSATFCPFNETINERKGYSKFHLRLELDAGSWLTVEIKRDNEQRWQKVYTTTSQRSRTISVPVLPARCDSVEIRISGKGKCVIRTLVREFFVGSDV